MLSKPYGTVRAVVRDPDGTVVDRHEQEINSYVRGFFDVHEAIWGDTDVTNVKDVDGVNQTLEAGGASNIVGQIVQGAGGNVTGIQIGDSNAAESISDFQLDSKLETNIAYGACTVGGTSVSGSSASLVITRTFTNNTGSQVIIREIGLVIGHDDSTGSSSGILALRDIGSPITSFLDGQSVTIEYELQITV